MSTLARIPIRLFSGDTPTRAEGRAVPPRPMPHYDLTDRPMYDAERYTRATVAESPSLLYNNLTAGPSSLGYVHGSQAIVVPVERALSGDPSEKRPILTEGGNRTAYQVKIVTLGAETFFVLCTAEAVHVFDDSGRALRHARPLPGAAAVTLPDGTEMANFARGVCSSCSEDGRAQLCVGTANGSVLVMEYDGARFRDAASLDGHYQVPIADLGSEVDSFRGSAPPDSAGPRAVMASADDAGVVVAWRAITSDRFEAMFWLQLESPAVAVAARGDQIVAAETSGRVSFISLRTQKVYCELQAHSRYLSALDMHPTQDVFATVAEDSTLAVWELPMERRAGAGRESGADPRCVFAACWPDGMLTGVAFCGERWRSLAVCAHDETEICVWQ